MVIPALTSHILGLSKYLSKDWRMASSWPGDSLVIKGEVNGRSVFQILDGLCINHLIVYSKEKQKPHIWKLIFTLKWNHNAGHLLWVHQAYSCFWFCFSGGKGRYWYLVSKNIEVVVAEENFDLSLKVWGCMLRTERGLNASWGWPEIG